MVVHCILGTQCKRNEAGQQWQRMTIGLTWCQSTTWLVAGSI